MNDKSHIDEMHVTLDTVLNASLPLDTTAALMTLQTALLFPPDNLLLRLYASVPSEQAIGVGYALQFCDSLSGVLQSISYTECFQEFYQLTKMIPLLNHGDGRRVNLYDTATGCIVQFNVMDPPSQWCVLSPSLHESVQAFRNALHEHSTGTPLPYSIYTAPNDTFPMLKDAYPDRAAELDAVLPSPLVLRTHKRGTWQVEQLQPIHHLINSGRVDDITKHFDQRPNDLRLATSKGSEPLHLACQRGRSDVVEMLLRMLSAKNEGNAALSARNNSLCTPLLCAASELYNIPQQCIAVCRLLLEFGADVQAANDEGQTLLHFASSAACPELIQLALNHGGSVAVTDLPMYGSNTPLHSLCRTRGSYASPSRSKDVLQVAQLLINAGADVNARTIGDGSCPLHLIMWGSQYEDWSDLIRLLVKAGADPNATTIGIFGRSVMDSGFARQKYSKLLIELGAVDAIDTTSMGVFGSGTNSTTMSFGFTGSTPLFSSEPVLKTANAVMGLTANEAVSKAKQTSYDRASLLALVKKNDAVGVQYKLEHGADVNEEVSGILPLVYAANAGLAEMVGILLDAGADVNCIESSGYAAIHGAQPTCLQMLLDAGADTNILDPHGQSALTMALDYVQGAERDEYVKALLKHGALVTVGVSATSGRTAQEIMKEDPQLSALLCS